MDFFGFDDYEDEFSPPLGLYDRGARGADQIRDFFSDAGLPLPELGDYYKTTDGGRLVLLTPFACTIRITPQEFRLKGDHPHALKSLFSKAAGLYQIDINPGIITPIKQRDVEDIADAMETTGLLMNDIGRDNFGIIPGSSPRFPVVLDLDSNWVKLTSDDLDPLNSSVAEVKAILDRNYALVSKHAKTTPQDIYNPLREAANKAWSNNNGQPDPKAMKQFWGLCVTMKRIGKMVSPWEKEDNSYGNKNRIDTTTAAANYEKKLRTLGWAM